MVNKDSAHFIKYNMGKCIETNMIVDENLKILKKNGVIIEQERNQPVDIILGFPDILPQSFPVHQPRYFHIF